MRVAVITPYHDEPPAILRRCHDSVLAQGPAVQHILVSDGLPQPAVDGWVALHVRLPATRDVGNTPRLVGTALAAARDFDALCLLDSDNWFEPAHVATLLALAAREQAAIVTCARMLRRPDGSELGPCRESNGDAFNDANCYLFTRPAFPLMAHWGFGDGRMAAVQDRLVWQAVLASPLRRAHSPQPTLNYATTILQHYTERGETPPAGAKYNALVEGRWQRLTPAELLAKGVPLSALERLRTAG